MTNLTALGLLTRKRADYRLALAHMATHCRNLGVELLKASEACETVLETLADPDDMLVKYVPPRGVCAEMGRDVDRTAGLLHELNGLIEELERVAYVQDPGAACQEQEGDLQ